MSPSTNAYIVGMSDRAREELVGALRQTGYRESRTATSLRVLYAGGRQHNSPDTVIIDVADMAPDGAAALAQAQRDLPGTKVVLFGRRASRALDGDLPEGIWGLVPKTISARSLEDLIGFMTGRQRTIH